MQLIIEQIQPYITAIVISLVGLVATAILGVINTLKVTVKAYFEAKLSTEQRALLHRIAGEAYAYAETAFKNAGGEMKLSEALAYASIQLKRRGVTVTAIELQAAIEKAWLEYLNKK
ncbi:hypothetical protein KB559_11050 [Paenibacillus sp. Marseille-P2973]|uniref:phage holin, LLH family n=1 Tax=Paenibacillus sp. Marseille-P2973 TaxID=1871032 RepID=UPI001B39580B|nr:hypothetical protein [Paenibacillus sp. Marseille-P2973]